MGFAAIVTVTLALAPGAMFTFTRGGEGTRLCAPGGRNGAGHGPKLTCVSGPDGIRLVMLSVTTYGPPGTAGHTALTTVALSRAGSMTVSTSPMSDFAMTL